MKLRMVFMQITCKPHLWGTAAYKTRCTSSLWILSCQQESLKNYRSKPFQATMAQIMCILALLCFAIYIAENTDIGHDFTDVQIAQDSLSWSDKLQSKQVRLFFLNQPGV